MQERTMLKPFDREPRHIREARLYVPKTTREDRLEALLKDARLVLNQVVNTRFYDHQAEATTSYELASKIERELRL